MDLGTNRRASAGKTTGRRLRPVAAPARPDAGARLRWAGLPPNPPECPAGPPPPLPSRPPKLDSPLPPSRSPRPIQAGAPSRDGSEKRISQMNLVFGESTVGREERHHRPHAKRHTCGVRFQAGLLTHRSQRFRRPSHHKKQQWPIAVLKHSLLTVARPCGNSTRFPFHSQDCREHLALTSANASKPVSPGQFSHGEASPTAKLSGTRGIFWQGGAGAAGSHLRDAAFAPLRIDCGLRPCLCKLSRMAKADAVAGTPVWRRRNYLPPPTRLNDYAKYSMGLRPRLSAAAASPLVSKPWVPGARGENT